LILYLDTSSLIKLYVEESGSRDVEGLVAEASLVCTSVVTYPEARSALARLCRKGNLSADKTTSFGHGLSSSRDHTSLFNDETTLLAH
jgi:predicted nucleic acid-binding protein